MYFYCLAIFILDSCDINLRDQNGQTPLHITVRNNTPILTKALVQHGAKVTAKDNQGKTALQYCMDLVSDFRY